ncbi:effector-associated domain 2-containing protein [Streptomyces sp. SLBN-31]|uniref:effector-associated domain 2-containing protein n=1 Tax=Streptomyces sp. SLBN-31 TaxID=2768444 RepID=UPI001356921D|nr:trypsin-like peptidase domain-containing protein [Streptomyces sp. SLBN-31]
MAEVITGRTHGLAGRRGSGYRVSGHHVITSAHVVEASDAVLRVRFDADRPTEWATEARVVFASAGADLALLELTDLPARVPSALAHPRFTGLPDDDVTVQVSAVGFPLFKMRQSTVPADHAETGRPTRYRDSCHVDGRVSVLSNRREGTLEVAVAPPSDEVGPNRSPWEGMSGAAVWHRDAIIGVVAVHHRADGLNRLAAVRVTRWYEALEEAELEMMRRHAGLPPHLLLTEEAFFPPLPSRLLSLVNPAELWQVTDAIAALPSLRRLDGLDTLLEEVDPRLAAQRPRAGSLRFEVHGLLRTCRRYPGTFAAVVDALRRWEQDSEEVHHVEHVLRRLTLKYG